MTILWRPSMAVGHAMIDADHQKLIELINGVELTLSEAGGGAELTATLEALTLYTREHFQREEDLMSCLGYAGLEQHRQVHRTLRVQLGEIRSAVEAAKSARVPAGEVDRLVQLLRGWLLNHVLKHDMLLKPLLGAA